MQYLILLYSILCSIQFLSTLFYSMYIFLHYITCIILYFLCFYVLHILCVALLEKPWTYFRCSRCTFDTLWISILCCLDIVDSWCFSTWGKVLASCRLKWSSCWWIRPSFTCWRAAVRRCCFALCSWTSRTRCFIFITIRPDINRKQAAGKTEIHHRAQSHAYSPRCDMWAKLMSKLSGFQTVFITVVPTGSKGLVMGALLSIWWNSFYVLVTVVEARRNT